MLDHPMPPPVNGLDVNAISRASSASEDQGPSRVGFRVKTDWRGQTRSETTIDSCTIRGKAIQRSFTIAADEPHEMLGTNAAPSPQELLMSAVNACMVVGYVGQAALRGITLRSCRIETEGEIDLRGCLGIDEKVPPGFRRLTYTVFLEGDGTREQFEDIHQAVMATSPNYFNMAQPVQMVGRLA